MFWLGFLTGTGFGVFLTALGIVLTSTAGPD